MSDAKKVRNSKKIFPDEDKVYDSFERDLIAACRSLTYTSETDAKVIPFTARKPASRLLGGYVSALDLSSDQIEVRGFEEFFDRITSAKDWHGPREKRRSKQWLKLHQVLAKNLEDIRVIRVGKIRLDIYIAGIDASGRLAGVRTKAIET